MKAMQGNRASMLRARLPGDCLVESARVPNRCRSPTTRCRAASAGFPSWPRAALVRFLRAQIKATKYNQDVLY